MSTHEIETKSSKADAKKNISSVPNLLDHALAFDWCLKKNKTYSFSTTEFEKSIEHVLNIIYYLTQSQVLEANKTFIELAKILDRLDGIFFANAEKFIQDHTAEHPQHKLEISQAKNFLDSLSVLRIHNFSKLKKDDKIQILQAKFSALKNKFTEIQAANSLPAPSASVYEYKELLIKIHQLEKDGWEKDFLIKHAHTLTNLTASQKTLLSLDGMVLFFKGEKPLFELADLAFLETRLKDFKENNELINSLYEIWSAAQSRFKEQFRPLIKTLFVNSQLSYQQIMFLSNAAIPLAGSKIFNAFLSSIGNNTFEMIKNNLDSFLMAAHQERFPEKDINIVKTEFANKSEDVQFPLSRPEIEVIFRDYEVIQKQAEKLVTLDTPTLKNNIISFATEYKKPDEKGSHRLAKLNLLATVRELVKRRFHIFPNTIQMINVLAILNDTNGRRLAQIKTGEGKSIIAAVLAAYIAKIQPLDIITTSSDLAKRDVEKFKDFFQQLGLNASHNANARRSEEDYNADIIYGPNYSFEHDFLFQELGMLYYRKFKAPIQSLADFAALVDEVDSLLLDMQKSPAIISSTPPKEYAIPSEIYIDILDLVRTKKAKNAEQLYEQLAKNHSGNYLTPEAATRWWKSAVSVERNDFQKGVDYTIKPNEQGRQTICIVDYKNTGSISTTSRWHDGVHELLEAKEGLPPSSETLTAAEINHIQYFNLYGRLIGITGTLGDEATRNLLFSLYNVTTYDSPSYWPNHLNILPPIIVANEKPDSKEPATALSSARDQRLHDYLADLVNKGRPALVLCETIKESERILAMLKRAMPTAKIQIYNGVQEQGCEDVLSMAGLPGMITIATNTAGRGADIRLTPEAEKNGGLCVLFLFLAFNRRVERQGFGRAARYGGPGSALYLIDEAQLIEQLQNMRHWDTPHEKGLELFNLWRMERDKYNARQAEAQQKQLEESQKKFALLKCFFDLPPFIKQDTYKQWAVYYTRIERFERDQAHQPQRQLNIERFSCTQLLEFWEKHIPLSLVAHVVRTKNTFLTALMKHAPQILRDVDQSSLQQSQDKIVKILAKLTPTQLQVLSIHGMHDLFFGKKPLFKIKDIEFLEKRSEELVQHEDMIKTEQFSSMLHAAKNLLGEADFVLLLSTLLDNQHLKLPQVLFLINSASFLANSKVFPTFIKIIPAHDFDQIKSHLDNFLIEAHREKFPDKPIAIVKAEFSTKSAEVQFPLPEAEIEVIFRDYEVIQQQAENLAKLDTANLTKMIADCVREYKKPDEKGSHRRLAKLNLLAANRELIKRQFHIFPNINQMINVLAILNAPNGRRLGQIKTGEGKSIIAALLACFIGSIKKLDIITTSRELAIRDVEKFDIFFKANALTATHNSTDSRSSENYAGNIVYGIPADFEHDFLFQQQGTRHFRDFDDPTTPLKNSAGLVDEVDSGLIDMEINPSIISVHPEEEHELPSEIYTDILNLIKNKTVNNKEELHTYLSQKYSKHSITAETVARWCKSAIVVLSNRYRKDRDYVITTPADEKSPKLCIVDYKHTGAVLATNRWQNGIHEMLEAKEGLKPRAESLVSADITHSNYFNSYGELYGITGTLGDAATRQELFTVYGVSNYDSPSYWPNHLQLLSPIIVRTSKSETKEILSLSTTKNKDEQLKDYVSSLIFQGRPALLLCETIEQSNEVAQLLKGLTSKVQLYNAVQSEDSEKILALAGAPGMITVATNTAGRGADIRITPESAKNGGLCVLFLFLAANRRVERQGFGRAARYGAPGTAHYFLEDTQIINELRLMGYQCNGKESDRELFDLWQQHRDYYNKVQAQERIQHAAANKKRFAILKFFLDLPQAVKENTNKAWGFYYNRIFQYFEDYSRQPQKMLAVDAFVAQQLQEFWKYVEVYDVLMLHHAVATKNMVVTKILLAHISSVSDLEQENNEGETPIQIAEKSGNPTFGLLKNHLSTHSMSDDGDQEMSISSSASSQTSQLQHQ